MTAETYFDFLGLETAKLDRTRLVVFYGESGTGKSTAMTFLAERHPAFRELPQTHFYPREPNAKLPDVSQHVILVDELQEPTQLQLLPPLLKSGNRLIVASHVHPWRFAKSKLRWATRVFDTNKDSGKIAWRLQQMGMEFNQAGIDRYIKSFGPNFLDLEYILERYPEKNFDKALDYFIRFCELKKTPTHL